MLCTEEFLSEFDEGEEWTAFYADHAGLGCKEQGCDR
jgi:hypothetical protein